MFFECGGHKGPWRRVKNVWGRLGPNGGICEDCGVVGVVEDEPEALVSPHYLAMLKWGPEVQFRS